MSIRIIKPGLYSTVQDTGRYGYQKYGVPVGGAMDTFALRTANLLAGNCEHAPALEMTMRGPELEFESTHWAAVCGADMNASVDGEPLPLWRPVRIEAGSRLSFQSAEPGCRAYLAVFGKWNVQETLGSTSTYARASFGGYEGRPLREGDRIEIRPFPKDHFGSSSRKGKSTGHWAPSWFVSPHVFPLYDRNPVIRVIRGPEFDLFDHKSRSAFFHETFRLTPRSDRMGFQLEGPALTGPDGGQMLSEAVTAGTIQVPQAGRPIILMADCQTTGGYPRIAQVASVDLPVLAQLKPGDRVEFAEISHHDTERLYMAREKEMRELKKGISLKWKEMC